MTAPISARSWIRLTSLGWLLGVVLVIAIALVSEMVGVRAAQLPVGLGMGLGVGIAQERGLHPLWGASRAWRWATVIGFALPFMIVDVTRLIGIALPYSLYGAVTMGGAAAGTGQAWVLRPPPIGALWWVLTNTLGWTAGGLMVAAADSLGNVPGLRGLTGAFLYLALVAIGGVFLGLATSIPLSRGSILSLGRGRERD